MAATRDGDVLLMVCRYLHLRRLASPRPQTPSGRSICVPGVGQIAAFKWSLRSRERDSARQFSCVRLLSVLVAGPVVPLVGPARDIYWLFAPPPVLQTNSLAGSGPTRELKGDSLQQSRETDVTIEDRICVEPFSG
jgi:hypothetical protein